MISVQINHKFVTVSALGTLIQACEEIGEQLPRFCYHSSLPVAANCRMCLVQLEDSPKPIAACAVPSQEGLKVLTNSFSIKQAREFVLEFLLINHPLDCPICDQGGECDLQDQTMIFGSDRGRFYEIKRATLDFNLGTIIKTSMNRCIHCTRCVRFLQNLLQTAELGILGRGYSMKIMPFLQTRLYSALSGNLADICPVGALTSKPYAFTARPWELSSYVSLALEDSLGSMIRIDMKGTEIMRILPYGRGIINDEWITDKTRYNFDGYKKQKLVFPILVTGSNNGLSNIPSFSLINIKESFFLIKKISLDFFLSYFFNKGYNLQIKISNISDLIAITNLKNFKNLFTVNSMVCTFYDELNNKYDDTLIINLYRKNFLFSSFNFTNFKLDNIYYFSTDPISEYTLLFYKLNSNCFSNPAFANKLIITKQNNSKMEFKNFGLSGKCFLNSLILSKISKNFNNIVLVGQAFYFRSDFNESVKFNMNIINDNLKTNFMFIPINTTTMHVLNAE